MFYSLLSNSSSPNPDGPKQRERELDIKKHQKRVLKSSRQEYSDCSHITVHTRLLYIQHALTFVACVTLGRFVGIVMEHWSLHQCVSVCVCVSTILPV